MEIATRQNATRMPSEAHPKRMGALAKLPVFLDLADKRAVVAGGSAMAAWKAELLAASWRQRRNLRAGARARRWRSSSSAGAAGAGRASAPSVDARRLARRGGCPCAMRPTTEEAQGVLRCGREAQASIVNVIDKPAYCQFQFGSIVNRSPVVIGISTDGAAPILGAGHPSAHRDAAAADAGDMGCDRQIAAGDRQCAPVGRAAAAGFWERFSERAFGHAAACPAAEGRARR